MMLLVPVNCFSASCVHQAEHVQIEMSVKCPRSLFQRQNSTRPRVFTSTINLPNDSLSPQQPLAYPAFFTTSASPATALPPGAVIFITHDRCPSRWAGSVVTRPTRLRRHIFCEGLPQCPLDALRDTTLVPGQFVVRASYALNGVGVVASTRTSTGPIKVKCGHAHQGRSAPDYFHFQPVLIYLLLFFRIGDDYS